MPSDEQINSLIAQVETLTSQLAQLRERVAELEQGAGLSHVRLAPSDIPALPRPVPSILPSANTGLKLLNRAGALTLFIGILFFFKYAVDNQWIGAVGRVVLGVIAGFVLLAAGEWLRKRGQTIFAQGVSACGIATLYISAYAASGYYDLINPLVAFLALIAISAGALGLSVRSSDAVLAVVGYLGAIAALGLLRALDPKIWSPNVWAWFGFVYLLLVEALVLIQAGVQNRRFLIPVIAAAVALQTFYVINPQHPMVCVLFFLMIAGVHFRAPRAGAARAWSADRYAIGHCFAVMAGLRFLVFWFGRVSTPDTGSSLLSEMESVFLAVYGVLLLVAAVLRKSAVDRLMGLTLLAVVIGKLYVIDVWFLTRFYRISAFVALGLLLLASSFVYSRWKQRTSA